MDRHLDPSHDEDRLDAETRELVRCSSCGNELADRGDVLGLDGQQPVRTEVNPHGHAFQVITFGRVHGAAPVGPPETEHSWHPGYAWTIVVCAGCGAHLGWRFDAIASGSHPRFWGLILGRISGVA